MVNNFHLSLTFTLEWSITLTSHILVVTSEEGFIREFSKQKNNLFTLVLSPFAMENGSVIYDGTVFTLPYDCISVCSYALSKFFCVPLEGLELHSVSRSKMVVLMICDCGSSPREKHA